MPGARIERGDRVALRTVEREDASFLQRAYANPELRHPLGRRLKNVSQVEAKFEELAADDEQDQFLVCIEGDDAPPGRPADGEVTPVGLVVARNVTRRPNVAFWVVPDYQRDGYATEAVSLVIETLFRSYDVPSIGAGVYDFNEASQGLLESLGFTREGRQRKYKFVDGEYRDNLKYGLLREEWREQTCE
ncbi:N-acetyltransferase [Halobacteriales archaeon SW_6_65_15]|jgi:RimJ/RimL family protein N-acetyltransferase|nr:MAG: N-acetyltransferase [Halobacteriales archaeon SW_6_65_15]